MSGKGGGVEGGRGGRGREGCGEGVFTGGRGGILKSQKRPFVHIILFVRILEGLFALLAECSQFCLRSF